MKDKRKLKDLHAQVRRHIMGQKAITFNTDIFDWIKVRHWFTKTLFKRVEEKNQQCAMCMTKGT